MPQEPQIGLDEDILQLKHELPAIKSGASEIQYTIEDTPGYGDDLNFHDSIDRITQYIEGKHLEYYQTNKEEQGAVSDPRVLYFIAAHRFKGIDKEFLTRLSGGYRLWNTRCLTVPVLPIIAKADTITIEEKADFKELLNLKFRASGIEVCNWFDVTSYELLHSVAV
eukprot:gene5029-6130_t